MLCNIKTKWVSLGVFAHAGRTKKGPACGRAFRYYFRTLRSDALQHQNQVGVPLLLRIVASGCFV